VSNGKDGLPFRKKVAFDQPELLAARWWNAGQRVAASAPGCNKTLTQLAIAAGVLGVVGIVIASIASSGSDVSGGRQLVLTKRSFDGAKITKNALDAQRADGWDVGSAGEKLEFHGAVPTDATGAKYETSSLAGLAKDLAPSRSELAPWYVSTLFQSVELPSDLGLRHALRPISTDATRAAFARGAAVDALFAEAGSPADVAIVSDLPGADSVAFAAGLAPRFDPVFAFDNWPHPRGVTPSHLTLASAAYYRSWFLARRAAAGAPPLFVLDRDRLAPYTDDAARFDNRYLARLPDAAALKALGVKHVLYVVPAGAPVQELDDLNDAFLEFAAAGIDVKVLPLSDLAEAPVAKAAAGGGTSSHRTYHYGGSPLMHYWFWRNYGWHAPSVGAPPAAAPSVSRGAAYSPEPRSTPFSARVPQAPSAAGGRARPQGFGTVTFHQQQTTSGGRSGSFGRGSSYSG
jgi:hypothetical protein